MKSVSRQRKWQIKRRKEGLCETCGCLVFRAGYCRKHYVLRKMRKFAPNRAEALTRRILATWCALEMPDYSASKDNDTFTPAISKWVEKWEKRIAKEDSYA